MNIGFHVRTLKKALAAAVSAPDIWELRTHDLNDFNITLDHPQAVFESF